MISKNKLGRVQNKLIIRTSLDKLSLDTFNESELQRETSNEKLYTILGQIWTCSISALVLGQIISKFVGHHHQLSEASCATGFSCLSAMGGFGHRFEPLTQFNDIYFS